MPDKQLYPPLALAPHQLPGVNSLQELALAMPTAHQLAAVSILASVQGRLSPRSVMVAVGLGTLSRMIPQRRLSLGVHQPTTQMQP